MAVACSVAYARTSGQGDPASGRGDLAWFRQEFYACLTARADALFELTDAVLCADRPVTSLVELTMTAEHRRGHGAMYDALNAGRVEPQRLRRALASLPLPTMDGRIVLAVRRQGRRAPRAEARGRRPAPQPPEATPGLGGPSRVCRARPTAAPSTASPSSGQAEHAPELASPSRPPTMDLPEAGRT